MIYIGFSSSLKFKIGSEAIKLWIGAPYSHVYIRFESSHPEIPSNIYHAANGMVHFRSFDNFKRENKILKEYKIQVTPELRVKILAHCMNLSGEPYGTTELLKILATDVLHLFGVKIKTYNGKGYICSELVGVILNMVFGKDLFEKPLHLINPKDVDVFLANRGIFYK